MARTISSARRKRRLRAPASARALQAARRNADSEEDFDIVLKGKIPGVSGELDLKRRGSDRAPTAKATTMLILVAGASLAAITITVICKLVAAPALLLAIAALTAFASVLIAGAIISFRRDAAAPVPPGGRTRSSAETLSAPLVRQAGRRLCTASAWGGNAISPATRSPDEMPALAGQRFRSRGSSVKTRRSATGASQFGVDLARQGIQGRVRTPDPPVAQGPP
jgi:hypothetical protein